MINHLYTPVAGTVIHGIVSNAGSVAVKNGVEFISKYEEVVARAAAARGVDGVVCGHVHTAEFRDFDGIEYWNDGDWVEGCSALVEHFYGCMEILHWPEEIAKRARREDEAASGEQARSVAAAA